VAQLSSYEQYMLELINLARLDPAAEAARRGIDLNQGLAAGTITTASKQPLAGNDYLATAAAKHSAWMLATGTFSHTGANGSSPGDRMSAAGYKFTGAWTWGENIAWRGTTGTVNMLDMVRQEENGLFLSAGHRANLLNPNFREVGIGIEAGVFKGYNAVMSTQNFAKSGTLPFLTGVAYTDSDANGFYTPGEGRGGIRVDARLAGGATTTATTAAAGGYEAQLAAGTYDVALSGGGLANALGLTLAIGSENVKLDLIGQDSVASSASLTMGANLKGATLLGLNDLAVTGNGLGNVIAGNSGSNTLNGGAGADTLRGGAGNDVFVLRAGEANGDRILDFAGNGAAAGDTLRFEGYAAGAKLAALANGQWQVADGTRTDIFTINGTLDASDYGFFGSLAPTPTPAPPTSPTIVFNDPVTGTSGNDPLYGNAYANVIGGGAGDDSLFGNGGDDTLYGGAGSDTLVGGTGNDLLVGGAGADWLFGGSGADRFIIRAIAESSDTIIDFSKGAGDRLDLGPLLGSLGLNGANPFAAGYVRTTQAGADVRVDVDANGGGDSYVPLARLQNLTTAALGQDFLIWS
jgi:hypothetical protein